jgi:hypothetical protein
VKPGVSGVFDIKIIAVTINRLEHSFVVRNGINTTDDLRGKRIAVSRYGSASDITTRLVLRYWKLNPEKDVSILQSGNTPHPHRRSGCRPDRRGDDKSLGGIQRLSDWLLPCLDGSRGFANGVRAHRSDRSDPISQETAANPAHVHGGDC